MGGHPAARGLLVVAEQPVDLGPVGYSGEDLLLLTPVQIAEDIGGVVVVQLLDDAGCLPWIQRRQRLARVRILRHLGQRLAGELRRQRLHDRYPLVLIQRRQHIGQIRRLEIVGSADEMRDVALPDQVDHPVEQLDHGELGLRVIAGVGSGRIRRRSTRVGEACTTSNSRLPRVKRSPEFGIRPANSTRRPPTVVERLEGIVTPNCSSRASSDRLPSVSKIVGAIAGVGRTSSSCSSKISPTNSSSRSSNVAMPSVPPNSSSTTARCRRSRCMSSSRSPQVRLAGVTATDRTGNGSPGSSLNRSKACSMPMISSSVPRITGMRLYPLPANTSRISSSGAFSSM